MLSALFTDVFAAHLEEIRQLGRVLQWVAGMVMIEMGVALITGQLSTLSYWLLDIFPGFTSIG